MDGSLGGLRACLVSLFTYMYMYMFEFRGMMMVVLVVGIFAFFVFRGSISMLYYYYYYGSLLWRCVDLHVCMDGWMDVIWMLVFTDFPSLNE